MVKKPTELRVKPLLAIPKSDRWTREYHERAPVSGQSGTWTKDALKKTSGAETTLPHRPSKMITVAHQSMGYLGVSSSLCFIARLSAKPWKWFLILKQIQIHFHKNVFTLVLGLTVTVLELRNGLFAWFQQCRHSSYSTFAYCRLFFILLRIEFGEIYLFTNIHALPF